MPTHFTVKCNLLVAQSGTTIQDVAELYHLHLHLSLKRGGSLGHHSLLHNQFPPFSPSSTALWDLANSRPVHCLVLSSHLFFFCLPCLLPLFTVPCKMVLARPDERETCPYHFSLLLFTMVRRFLYGPTACWILAQTSSSVTWSLYEIVLSCGNTSFQWLVFFFGAQL